MSSSNLSHLSNPSFSQRIKVLKEQAELRGQLALRVLQAPLQREPPDLLDLPEIRVLQALQALLEPLETQALQEVLVQPDRQEVQVQRVLLVILDLLVLLVPLVLLAVLVLLGRLERRVLTQPSLDQLVQQVRRERQGLLAQ